MVEFEYVTPSSLEAALQVLGDASHPAMALAGGTRLLLRKALYHLRPVEQGDDKKMREE
jgi:CO/xanthine dehydrogenase FAD-binding subunit